MQQCKQYVGMCLHCLHSMHAVCDWCCVDNSNITKDVPSTIENRRMTNEKQRPIGRQRRCRTSADEGDRNQSSAVTVCY